ncbi:MAG: helix-turn-helix transcriptional regulator, partial [Pseudonocardiales bacterium]|nr:helix-turn-helix transcriptional regulator [Pseudonocardiales bacterium]
REAAAMVASGLSNREISERLGVSVRTVEGHIYHACVKLGVSNRAALAALLNRPSPRDRHYATSPVRGSTVTGCIRVGRYAC